MSNARYTIYARDVARRNLGEIADYSSATIQDRFNDIGGWVLSAPIESRAANLLTETGGIIVLRDNLDRTGPHVVFSGPVTDIQPDTNSITIAGASDDIILAEKLGSPDPTTDIGPWNTEQDLRQGIASTVMLDYMRVNAIVGQAAGNRGVSGLALGTDIGAGLYVYGQARWISLLALMQDLALKGGLSLPSKSLGFRVLQSDVSSATVTFSVYVPTNRSSTVVISNGRGTLGQWTRKTSRPGVTRVYVLGQGQGVDRQVIDRADGALSTKYGYQIEGIVDRRDTNDVLTLQQSGDAALAASGEVTTISYTAVDVPSLVWGKDYNKGDVIGVRGGDGSSLVEVVRGVDINLSTPNSGGSDKTAEVQPVISTPGDTADDPADRQQRQVARDVNNLQRNVDSLLSVIANQWDIGNIRLTARTTASAGWLLCRGQAVSRITYSGLFGAIGATFGAGDGSTTFNVPDLRDRVPIGVGGTYTLGQTVGAATVDASHSHGFSLTIPSHSHSGSSLTIPNHSHSGSGLTGPSHSHSGSGLTGPSHTHGVSTLTGPSHTHGVSTLTGPSHTHANSTLTAPNHSHTAGAIAIPNHSHSGSGLTGPSHSHAATGLTFSGSGGTTGNNSGNTTVRDDKTPADHTAAADTHTHTFTPAGSVGGSTAAAGTGGIGGSTATDGGGGHTSGTSNGQLDQLVTGAMGAAGTGAIGGSSTDAAGTGAIGGSATDAAGTGGIGGSTAAAGTGAIGGSTATDGGGGAVAGTTATDGGGGAVAGSISTGGSGALSIIQPSLGLNYEIYTTV